MRRLSAPTFRRLRAPDLARLQEPARILATAIPFGLAVVGFYLAGTLLGNDSGDEQPAQIERASFAVELPAGWGETTVASAAGIKLSAPLAAAPRGEGGAGLVVARVPDIATLDRRFRAQLGAQGRRTEVQLGRLEAWRYVGLPAGKQGLVATAYLAPTTGDPVLFICYAPRSDARAPLAACEGSASTVALRGDRPASLAAVTRHTERVVSVMAGLRRERLRGRRQLARVELASDQAPAARDLERTYGDAAARLAQGEPPAGAAELDDLVGSLRLTASAYEELADAAAEADRARYRAASEAVREGEEAVRRHAADS